MKAFPDGYTKKRLIICTDIGGGDRDDHQSMIHYLFYANRFDLEGIIVGRPKGKPEALKAVLKAYRQDFPKLFSKSNGDFVFPTAKDIANVCYQGAKPGSTTNAQGFSEPTHGSNAIIKAARRIESRLLNILSWGSVTDIAQAIHDAPDIVPKIRVFSVGRGGYNEDLDPAPYDYLRRNKKLIWIDCDSTVRGIYMPGLNSVKKYGNVGFVKKVIQPAGHLGKLFYEISQPINVNKYGIKMGDSGSLLFIFNGSFDDPAQESWGGYYRKEQWNRWTDTQGNVLGVYPGAGTLAKHRTDILKDWEQRLKWLY